MYKKLLLTTCLLLSVPYQGFATSDDGDDGVNNHAAQDLLTLNMELTDGQTMAIYAAPNDAFHFADFMQHSTATLRALGEIYKKQARIAELKALINYSNITYDIACTTDEAGRVSWIDEIKKEAGKNPKNYFLISLYLTNHLEEHPHDIVALNDLIMTLEKMALSFFDAQMERFPQNIENRVKYIHFLKELLGPKGRPLHEKYDEEPEGDTPWAIEAKNQILQQNYVAARYCLDNHLEHHPEDIEAYNALIDVLKIMLPDDYFDAESTSTSEESSGEGSSEREGGALRRTRPWEEEGSDSSSGDALDKDRRKRKRGNDGGEDRIDDDGDRIPPSDDEDNGHMFEGDASDNDGIRIGEDGYMLPPYTQRDPQRGPPSGSSDWSSE